MPTLPRNTVQTVLSPAQVEAVEYLIHEHWDTFEWGELTHRLMRMLQFYTEKYSDDSALYPKPAQMVRIVSDVLKLNETLISIQSEAKPWDWVARPDGGYLREEKASK